MRGRLILSLAALGGPFPAMGETPARFACAISRVCDGSGHCRAGTGRIAFVIDRERVNRRGEGTVRLRYGGTSAEAVTLSDIGPVVWSERETDVQSLSVAGGDFVLWQRFDLATDSAEIHFLRCEE